MATPYFHWESRLEIPSKRSTQIWKTSNPNEAPSSPPQICVSRQSFTWAPQFCWFNPPQIYFHSAPKGGTGNFSRKVYNRIHVKQLGWKWKIPHGFTKGWHTWFSKLPFPPTTHTSESSVCLSVTNALVFARSLLLYSLYNQSCSPISCRCMHHACIMTTTV